MDIKPINIEKFTAKSFSLWNDKWMLLTAGSLERQDFNAMTISWGSIGIMWNKPFVQIAVRPSRLTYQFINDYPDFSLCVFPDTYHEKLQILGSKSGREMDKINHSGFTPVKASRIASPVYKEAELAFECRKIYWQDFEPDHFLDMEVLTCYPRDDFHRVFFGHIIAVQGTEQYQI